MKKQKINILIYTLIILVAIFAIILSLNFSQTKFKDNENTYKKTIEEQSQEIKDIRKQLDLLKEENLKLSKELNETRNKKSENISSGETYNQATKLLSDIYILIESGDKEKAKKELEKFDTATFDDTIINYKKALLKLIE